MRPSSLGGAAYFVALCLSVRLSVRPVIVDMGDVFSARWRHRCTFRQALRAAYGTAISAAQILVYVNIVRGRRGAKRLWGEMSFHGAKCPWGEMSVG